jgi:beta-glucosidase
VKSLTVFFLTSTIFSAIALSQSAVIGKKVDSLISVMTLEEKLGQLNQMPGRRSRNRTERISEEEAALLREGKIGSFLGVVGASETARIQRIAVRESRLGIPVLFGWDVIHGFRTVFPIPLAEASTWNPDLIERAARVAANEASAAGIHWTFAPMVDIARDPRWGRIAEGSGEDPFLGSAFAAARVRGFQGTHLLDRGSILACAKHFAAYGGAEAGREYNTVDVSERTLREIYLPPFKAAVDAGAWTLMSAFNEIAGVPSSGNHWLLSDVLRGEWGFKGFVVSDYTSVMELQNHGVAGSRTAAGILALSAGVDVDMVSGIYGKELVDAVRTKKLSEDVVDRAVRRVLNAKFAYGLFDNPYRNSDTLREKSEMLTPEDLDLARTVAQQSIVLLKNERNVLPLDKSVRTIALIGPLADNRRDPLGPWAGFGRAEDVVTVLEGVKQKLSPQTKLLYALGCGIAADSADIQKAVGVAKQADVVVVVLGEEARMSGEAASRSNLDLPGRQNELLKAIHQTGKPIVLVLMNGRPLTIAWAAENVNAIVESWFLGIQSGNAIADMLFGDVNPSGKLPVTFPRSVGQIPVYYNHKNTGRPFVDSSKFTSKFLDISNTPLYPFGYGLSYTSFTYSNVRASSPTITKYQEMKITVDVENTGKRAGDEIVQLYVQDEVASVTRPVQELKGFKRINLKPREKQSVEFILTFESLSFYNLEMKKLVEPGTFKAFVGGNSVDVLEAKFVVE